MSRSTSSETKADSRLAHLSLKVLMHLTQLAALINKKLIKNKQRNTTIPIKIKHHKLSLEAVWTVSEFKEMSFKVGKMMISSNISKTQTNTRINT